MVLARGASVCGCATGTVEFSEDVGIAVTFAAASAAAGAAVAGAASASAEAALALARGATGGEAAGGDFLPSFPPLGSVTAPLAVALLLLAAEALPAFFGGASGASEPLLAAPAAGVVLAFTAAAPACAPAWPSAGAAAEELAVTGACAAAASGASVAFGAASAVAAATTGAGGGEGVFFLPKPRRERAPVGTVNAHTGFVGTRLEEERDTCRMLRSRTHEQRTGGRVLPAGRRVSSDRGEPASERRIHVTVREGKLHSVK